MVKAFGIFEGGGAKGLAHIGALRASEINDIRFIGIAGASAGAIVASLIAAGYTANELFDPDSHTNESVFDENIAVLFGKIRWYIFVFIKGLFRFANTNFLLRTIFSFVLLTICIALFLAVSQIVISLITWSLLGALSGAIILFVLIILINRCLPFGIFSSDKFEEWLNKKLSVKIFGDDEHNVTFEDIKMPLKIIATDIKSKKPIVFSKEDYSSCSVAWAVRCSMTIPGVFSPNLLRDMTLVDGGVLSNFPAWVFDKERKEQKEVISTVGFRLHSLNPFNKKNKPNSLFNYILNLGTVFFGDNYLQIREIEDLHLISAKVSAGTLDFNLNKQEKRSLFNEGYVAAINFFRDEFTGPKNKDEINYYLKSFHHEVISLIKEPDTHLRVNIAVPIKPLKQKLRILYSYNMEEDTDDKLELKIGTGAIGNCWLTGKPILVDMENARTTFETIWNMNKYEQALIRPTLKTLLSFPILFDGASSQDENNILAILSIDSDNDLLDNFSLINVSGSDLELGVKALCERVSKVLRK